MKKVCTQCIDCKIHTIRFEFHVVDYYLDFIQGFEIAIKQMRRLQEIQGIGKVQKSEIYKLVEYSDILGKYDENQLQPMAGNYRNLQPLRARYIYVEQYRYIKNSTGTKQNITSTYKPVQVYIEQYRYIQNSTGTYRTVQIHTELYNTVQVHCMYIQYFLANIINALSIL